MKSSNVYVDGFNLYFGALKGTRHKWLDLQELFERLRPDDDIQTVHYFSAPVGGANQQDHSPYRGFHLRNERHMLLSRTR